MITINEKIIFGLVVFVFSSLVLGLINVQLFKGNTFEKVANNNKTFSVILPEERGVFFDRYDQPMVYNKPVYFKLDSYKTSYTNKTRITRDEALQIMSQDSNLITTELERMYLYPKSTAQVLGYVGKVNLNELSNDSSLNISDKVGKFGLEKKYQNLLRGSKGIKTFEINALGEKQRLISKNSGFPGKNIPTTIDPYLSEISLKAMGDNKGAVVILDASNSEVLSLISTPTFDNSILSETFLDEKLERRRTLEVNNFFSNPQKLFFNRAISGLYPPGSVFKLITSLAGLEGNKIDKNTIVLDDGVLKVGEYSYANWYFTQYGRKEGEISLIRALARSNDIYFYKVAEWVGPEKLKEMSSLFSLGSKTEIQLQGEASGVIPDPEWKQRVIGERWFLGNTYHMGIGQGDILVSPIQIAQMVQGLANKGNICKPTLIKDSFIDGQISEKSRCKEVGVSEENINLVLEGMIEACSPGGTGFPFFNYNSKIFNQELSVKDKLNAGVVACKTGTSEVGGLDENGYRKTHGWFAAIINTKDLVNKMFDEDIGVNKPIKLIEKSTESAKLEDKIIKSKTNRELWFNGVKKHGFPDKIIIIALVESDEAKPYKEGSADAGPVVKAIFDWIKNGKEPTIAKN